MSGIAGIIDLYYDENTIVDMKDTLTRRGPDGSGFYHDSRCCMVQTFRGDAYCTSTVRPYSIEYANEKFVIVFDGRIYNPEDIKNEFVHCGIQYTGNTDAELMLCAYVNWGDKCLDKVNGVFAFGIWNINAKRLFIARDRMGIKPLFYSCLNGGFIFGSEIKTVLAYPDVQPCIKAEGAAQVLLLGPGRIPGSGVFCDIFELEQGELGEFSSGRFSKRRYWQLKDRIHSDSFEETAEKIRFLVTDSVQRQNSSDASVGCFLSGGLDSGVTTSICSSNIANNDILHTFSVDYENNDQHFIPGKFQPERDQKYIEIMRQNIRGTHHQVTLSAQDLLDNLENAVCARDLPGMADVDSSLLTFCGEIRKYVNTAISGECADEIFGGYPWYRDPKIRMKEGFPWSQNTLTRAAFLTPEHRSKLNPTEYVMDHYRTTVTGCDILPGTSSLERRMKEMMWLNIRWFMQTLIDRNDRMSMFHNLEVRAPFCDYRIVEYMYGVPWDFKDYNGREKGLLRYAMRDLLPDEIVNRKKSPYPKTYDPGYCLAVTAMLRKILESNDEPIYAIVDRSALEGLTETELSTPWYGQLMMLPQTIAYMIQINFWLRKYNITIL